MISVGIDLERIERFNIILKRGGGTLYRRVFTMGEQLEFGDDPVLLALCFTAKEAVSKTLGTGLQLGPADAVCCSDIEIRYNGSLNQPRVRLKGKASEIAGELGVSGVALLWHNSLSLACSIAGSISTVAGIEESRGALRASLATVAAYMERVESISGVRPRARKEVYAK
jgi:holo-[acyl-carrier protein] synthase